MEVTPGIELGLGARLQAKALLSSTLGLATMREGDGRNNVALFRIARVEAQDCATLAELTAAALAANEVCSQPLTLHEAERWQPAHGLSKYRGG